MTRKRIVRVLSLLLLLAVLVSGIPVRAHADAALEEARQSVVQVWHGYTSRQIPTILLVGAGTGFFVDESGEYIVTNRHVVNPDMHKTDEGKFSILMALSGKLPGEQIELFLNTAESVYLAYYRDSFYFFTAADLSLAEDGMDLAVAHLRTRAKNARPLPLADETAISVGDKVTAIGYPDISGETSSFEQVLQNVLAAILEDCCAGAPKAVYEASVYGGGIKIDSIVDQFVSGGQLSRIATDGGETILYTDTTVSQGNSGGPLVNATGCLVGVNTWTATGNQSASTAGLALSVSHVKSLLDQYNVPYRTGASGGFSGGSQQGSGDSGGMIFLYVFTGLFGIVVWVFLVKRIKKGFGPVSTTASKPASKPASGPVSEPAREPASTASAGARPGGGFEAADPVGPVKPKIHFEHRAERAETGSRMDGMFREPDAAGSAPTGGAGFADPTAAAPVTPHVSFRSGGSAPESAGMTGGFFHEADAETADAAEAVPTPADASAPADKSDPFATEETPPSVGFRSSFRK